MKSLNALRRASITFLCVFLCIVGLTSLNLVGRSYAQTRPVTVAPGYEINVFADTSTVPDFGQGNTGFGPTAIAFDSQGRLFVSDLKGNILILEDTNDDGVVDTVKTFASGITFPLGLEFGKNGDLYVTSSAPSPATGALTGRILRLRDTNGDDVADDITTLVDGLPSQGFDTSARTDRLKFGPDGMLYFGLGSLTDNGTPQPGMPGDSPLNATMLRIDPENPPVGGQATQANVFATGLRNPFGMAFDSVSGELFCTDEAEGEIGDNSPPDELNWVFNGGNYGFPNCNGIPDPNNVACAGVTGPLFAFTQHLTPTALAFYTGPQAGDSVNHMLVTVLKYIAPQGGDLEQFVLTGDAANGFQVARDPVTPQIASFGVIDPDDGPVDAAIDPISGDIYVARIDTVHHANPSEHHNVIYRIHRAGSDSQPFIGPVSPSSVTAGSGGVTITITGRHLKPGVAVIANGNPVTTRQIDLFHLSADIPASLTAAEGTIEIAVRNPDWMMSNVEPLAVNEPEPPAPQLNSLTVMKKNGKILHQVFVGAKAKKLRLVADGTAFDQGAQLLVNGTPLTLVSSSDSELVGAFTDSMVAAPGTLNVQIRNSTGKVSNILTLTVVSP